MNIDYAKPIELPVRKDPQGYVLIEHVRDEAWFYLRCLKSDFEDAAYVGCLHFEGVWHVSSTRFQKLRGYPYVEDTDLMSYYLVVQNSSLLRSLTETRTAVNCDWQLYDKRKYKHWVVESHDFYTNIVAAKVSFSIVQGQKAVQCFEIWNNI